MPKKCSVRQENLSGSHKTLSTIIKTTILFPMKQTHLCTQYLKMMQLRPKFYNAWNLKWKRSLENNCKTEITIDINVKVNFIIQILQNRMRIYFKLHQVIAMIILTIIHFIRLCKCNNLKFRSTPTSLCISQQTTGKLYCVTKISCILWLILRNNVQCSALHKGLIGRSVFNQCLIKWISREEIAVGMLTGVFSTSASANRASAKQKQ